MSLSTNVTDLAVRVATEAKALRTLINGNAADLTGLTTTQKTNLVAAINEVAAAVANASGIDDTATGTTTSWSSSKTSSEISAATAALIDTAPGTLDTLNELAAALGDDPQFATTIAAQIGTKAPIDSPTFTGTVGGITKAMVGLGNVDNTADMDKPVSTAQAAAIAAKVDATAVGDTTANFVASFEAGLV
jgi:hypothetical protein